MWLCIHVFTLVKLLVKCGHEWVIKYHNISWILKNKSTYIFAKIILILIITRGLTAKQALLTFNCLIKWTKLSIYHCSTHLELRDIIWPLYISPVFADITIGSQTIFGHPGPLCDPMGPLQENNQAGVHLGPKGFQILKIGPAVSQDISQKNLDLLRSPGAHRKNWHANIHLRSKGSDMAFDSCKSAIWSLTNILRQNLGPFEATRALRVRLKTI